MPPSVLARQVERSLVGYFVASYAVLQWPRDGPNRRTVTYHTPFTGADREADYAVAWAHFAECVPEAEKAA